MRKVRIVKYWLKLQHTNNCILKASWYFLFNEFCQNPNVKNWVAGVYNILAEIGLGDIFYNYGSLECKHVLGLVKQRLTDIYNQSIMAEVNNSSKSYMYKHLMSHYNLICQNLYIVSIRNLYVSYVFRLIVYVLKLVVIKMCL